MAPVSIPTTSRLPSSLRLEPGNPIVYRALNRLSRFSLLTISLDWLDEKNQSLSAPYLLQDSNVEEDELEDDFYPPARSLEQLRDLYTDMQARKGSKKEVLDRIVEGDWRHGLSLYQLAMADLQYLYDHPASQKWSAYRVLPLRTPSKHVDAEDALKVDRQSLKVPRFHPSLFLRRLQEQVLPDIKAHYTFERHRTLPVLLLRIFVLESPYNSSLAVADLGGNRSSSNLESSRTVYIAFPDASPHVFISRSQITGPATVGESRSLQSLIIQGVPNALSRPRERYTLKSTSLSSKNLEGLLHRRGAGRTGAAGGGWSIYADEKKRDSPLDIVLPSPPLSNSDKLPAKKEGGSAAKRTLFPAASREERAAKRARLVARARFGDAAKVGDGKGVERIDVVIEDPFPTKSVLGDPQNRGGGREEEETRDKREKRTVAGRRSNVEELLHRERDADDRDPLSDQEGPPDSWRPKVRLTFHGPHVFGGIRQLVEQGLIDGERMPGWMTGEDGVTIGAVRRGRIRGHKGSGI
ncbi:hypothetical protein VTK73DRAFT_8611 [Phialemonium thermophilum]|uniref:Uncharacterized protein n=1 Tax=Phialemonium thermophilum TaxID=223376 RepID=A0ABR3XNJ3_9PEZI